MSQITITFDQRSSNAGYSPVPVEIFNEQLVRVANAVVSLSDTRRVDVPMPGLYQVRAELPTGEIVATTVRVSDELPAPIATLVASEGSPRETLAWAYARQSVRQMSSLPRTPQPDVAEAFELPTFPVVPPPIVTVTGLYRLKLNRTNWQFISVDLEPLEDSSIAADDPRLIKELVLTQRNFPEKPEDWFPLYVRQSVRVTPQAPGQICFVTVPMGFQARLLFVRSNAEIWTGGPVRTLVSATRSDAETLLAYLEQGSYGAAKQIGEDITQRAIQILQEKKDDPFAACIAGYFLLRTRRLERQEWMRNLANWFPTIPDGAVIYGASLLRGDGAAKDRREARRYLLEAVKRGIPAYTTGLRLLFDSLRSLVGEKSRDNQLQSALARVRFVAAYTDWDVQTTTFAIPPEATWTPFKLPS